MDTPHQKLWAAIVNTIKSKNSDGMSYGDIARFLSMPVATVHGWANGRAKGKRIGYDNLCRCADKLGIPVESFFDYGEPANYDYIPKVAAKLGAGASLMVSSKQTDLLPFSKDFLHTNAINPRFAAIFDVVGDSMDPIVPEGAAVLVSMREEDKTPRSGQIVAARIGDEIMIKRFINMGSKFILQSENKNRPDHEVCSDTEDWAIIGVVRWVSYLIR